MQGLFFPHWGCWQGQPLCSCFTYACSMRPCIKRDGKACRNRRLIRIYCTLAISTALYRKDKYVQKQHKIAISVNKASRMDKYEGINISSANSVYSTQLFYVTVIK